MTNNTKSTISKKALNAARKQEAFNGLVEQINALVEKRVRWEQGTYAASNTELYGILGNCLDLFIEVKKSYDLPKGVNSLLDVFGIKYNSATSLELKLVRLVFASKDNAEHIGNRLFGYARVIRVASEAKQTSATLSQFIADNHGIEEIRRANKDGVTAAEKQKQQADLARIELIEPRDDELFQNFEMPDQLQPLDGEHFSLALVRKNADGTGSIVFGTNNGAAVSTVLSIAGKSLSDKAVDAAQADFHAKQESIKAANIAAVSAAIANRLKTSSVQSPQSTELHAAEEQFV